MSELCPPGFEYLFFGLFGISNRASSVIGPNVVQKIIDNAHGNNWMGSRSFLLLLQWQP